MAKLVKHGHVIGAKYVSNMCFSRNSMTQTDHLICQNNVKTFPFLFLSIVFPHLVESSLCKHGKLFLLPVSPVICHLSLYVLEQN